MSKICVNCQKELSDGDVFCIYCGTKQPEQKIVCNNCGKELPNEARFCFYCGTPIGGEAVPPTTASSNPFLTSDGSTKSFNVNGVTFNMQLVEGGMLNENVELSDFYIGETMVTQALWQTVMGDNPSADNSDLHLPVTNINTAKCKTFIVKLNKLTGESFDIPTASQWKYAYKGGTKSKGYKYAGTNDVNESGWVKSNSDGKLHPVAELLPNELGVYDMDGNAAELVQDEFVSHKLYNFNPQNDTNGKYEEGTTATGKKSDDFTGLRLTINIPVSEQVQKEKTEKEIKERYNYVDSLLNEHSGEFLLFDIMSGKLLKEKGYEAIEDFHEGLAKVKKDGKWGYINKEGREVIPCKYDFAEGFSEGLAPVEKGWETGKGSKWGYINKEGREVIPCKYDSAYDFSEGLAQVIKGDIIDGKRGYINKEGREVIPCKYDSASNFSEGLAKVEKDGKVGYINKEGREVIPCKYDSASDFREGLVFVDKDNHTLIIDQSGQEIVQFNCVLTWIIPGEGIVALKMN